MKHTFSILGGGIGGLSTAIALKKAGFEATVYEAAPEIKPVGAGIMLASNANQALNMLGLWPDLQAAGHIPEELIVSDEKGRTIQKISNQKTAQTYGFPTLTIHRADLQKILLSKLNPQQLVLGKKCMGFQEKGKQILLQFEDGSEILTDFLIAADGIHSPVRKQLLPGANIRYAGYTCWRGICDTPPKGLDTQVFSESWGSKGRFGIVPLRENKVYWFACVNAAPQDRSMASYGPDQLFEVFKDFHVPIPQLIRQTPPEQILWNDIIDLKPIDRYAFGRIALMGDAAHATTPNMGQGACQAIEGAVLLGECLRQSQDPEIAFQLYEKAKMDKAKWVVNNSWRFGKVAQLGNPLLCNIRNGIFRMIPDKSNEKRMKSLLHFQLPL